ncbi:DUF2971 domain-containing protein [Haloterrigena salinisoli]|uniref:DUF2971 domain-containing protein n=1 Tax=Haloterrigena salinisoli TaxID=3132747 RepID=UPI0030D4C93C
MSENGASSLPPVPHEDTKIWRYLDFTQLLSIVERSSLWFSRADTFNDPLEGSYSRVNVDNRRNVYENTEIPEERIDELVEDQSVSAKLHRNSSYINCWHINDRESMAMWELYSLEGQGIAIQSRIDRMKKALRSEGGKINREDTPVEEDLPREKIFTIGAVRYIDYDEHWIPEGNMYSPLFHKRLSYQHEKEFRIATSRFFELLEQAEGGVNTIDEVNLPVGMYMEVDVEELIENIHVSPTAPDWFLELIEDVLSKYSIDTECVTRSSLVEDPVF